MKRVRLLRTEERVIGTKPILFQYRKASRPYRRKDRVRITLTFNQTPARLGVKHEQAVEVGLDDLGEELID